MKVRSVEHLVCSDTGYDAYTKLLRIDIEIDIDSQGHTENA